MYRRSKGIAAWLGLFAMLMVFLGPLIGQGAALAHSGHAHRVAGEMDCGPNMGPMPASGEHHALAIWEKCGYCSLLFQHPPLLESGGTFIASHVPPAPFTSVEPATRSPSAPVFPGARSRAPPVER